MNKTMLAVLAVLALIAVNLVHGQNAKPEAPVAHGKFQILQTEFLHMGVPVPVRQPGVFRVNTETGESWLFVSLIDDKGKLVEYWQEIK